jgi:hypothetical protein
MKQIVPDGIKELKIFCNQLIETKINERKGIATFYCPPFYRKSEYQFEITAGNSNQSQKI